MDHLPPHLEFSIYLTDENDTHKALFAAADDFFAQYMALPDEIILNIFRRAALPVQEWHSIKHGAISIRLSSAHDTTFPALHLGSIPYTSFVCVRLL